mmetsp:Transcript_5626/g.17263  ORF Transcript_5626/g.17263 Transcript_5626/m.17263 type:complete len:219 (-) Transcript_5626:1714-2370(-)
MGVLLHLVAGDVEEEHVLVERGERAQRERLQRHERRVARTQERHCRPAHHRERCRVLDERYQRAHGQQHLAALAARQAHHGAVQGVRLPLLGAVGGLLPLCQRLVQPLRGHGEAAHQRRDRLLCEWQQDRAVDLQRHQAQLQIAVLGAPAQQLLAPARHRLGAQQLDRLAESRHQRRHRHQRAAQRSKFCVEPAAAGGRRGVVLGRVQAGARLSHLVA